MTRSGTICLLGAGASADAGYPLAIEIRRQFVDLVEAGAQAEVEHRRIVAKQLEKIERDPKTLTVFQAEPDFDAPTIADKFKMLWAVYEECAASEKLLAIPEFKDGRPQRGSAVMQTSSGITFSPYTLPRESENVAPTTLEGFFGFYDLLERPILRSLFANLRLPEAAAAPQTSVKPQDFRSLRQIALRGAYETLAPFNHDLADYLIPLLSVPGPFGHPWISTLNFDLAVEQVACDRGLTIFDGFSDTPRPDLPRPSNFEQAESPKLVRIWDTARSNLCPYVGFESVPSGSIELIKLHGSLGWFSIEEGSGDIGDRGDMRQNTVYAHMRLPYDAMARAGNDGNIQDLAVGGDSDIAMRSKDGQISRKAGSIWLRPSMIFGRATKMHSDTMWIELFARFSLALSCARYVLVVGYSWGDAHINDALLNAIAQGATLIDISKQCPSEHTLGLISQRFPTTFRETSDRVFLIGGGTRRVLAEREMVLPSGEMVSFDIPSALAGKNELPAEYSLRHALSS